MGGREAMRGLLAIDPEAKAVVSSGYSQDPVMANFRDYGFRDVLAKPYSVLDVSRVLSGLVGKGRTPTD
jgi:CheY-like chemotaxis protein